MMRCFVERWKTDSSLRGRVRLRFKILETGAPDEVAITIPDATLATCLTRVIEGLAFPAPTGGAIDIDETLTFEPPANKSLTAGPNAMPPHAPPNAPNALPRLDIPDPNHINTLLNAIAPRITKCNSLEPDGEMVAISFVIATDGTAVANADAKNLAVKMCAEAAARGLRFQPSRKGGSAARAYRVDPRPGLKKD
jgi:hypothetical protein